MNSLFKPFRSFRVRIMLLTVALSGVILVLFAASGWLLVYTRGINAIDREIKELSRRELNRFHPPEHWTNVEQSLNLIHGSRPDSAILLVRQIDGQILFRSSHWPGTLDHTNFDNPDTVERSAPPPPHHEADRALPAFHRPNPRGENRPHEREHSPPGPDPDPRRGFRQPERPIFLTAPEFSTVDTTGTRWRIGAVGDPNITLLVGINLENLDTELARIRNAYLMVMPVALLLIAAGGWVVARRALQPVAALTRTAQNITATGLDQRVPAQQTDAEFQQLIAVFNHMLDRLEISYQQAVRFSADAAHELKTPLAVIQGELEQAIQDESSESGVRKVFSNLLEETLRLKSITQKLLLLAQADAGRLPLKNEPVNVSQMLENLAEDLEAMDTMLIIETEIEPDLRTEGDLRLLQQALQNLADNAVKYNRTGGFIRLTGKRQKAGIVCSIANSGTDIPAEEMAKLFQRFYRGSLSRTRTTDGFGLGLSLAREIVRAHGGDLGLAESTNGVTRFSLTLPGAEISSV